MGGYDKSHILKAESEVLKKVKSGEAAWAQGGMVFKWKIHILKYWHHCYGTWNNWGISVIDYGGALGNMLFRHIDLFKGMNIEWNFIEQKHFVDYGKSNIPKIGFCITKEECLREKILILYCFHLCMAICWEAFKP